MKVIVCQLGARHRYAVARILEEAGLLSRLYTDSSQYSPLGRVSRQLDIGGPVGRLARREILDIPPDKVFSTDAVFWSDLVAPRRSLDHYVFRCRHRHQVLSRVMQRWGTGDADAVYVMYHENVDFARYAKDKGLRIIVDVFVNPLTDRIVNAQCAKYPGWESPMPADVLAFTEGLIVQSLDLADVALCPSPWVAQGVATLSPLNAAKVRLCPYGSSISYGDRVNTPVPGRVFYAGNSLLRKGLPDLAQAADRLRPRCPGMEVRIAGAVDPGICGRSQCRNLTFLGHLSCEQMREEFLSADMFVLPTHAEGLASAAIEAVVAGCPIITTACAGVEIDDGVDGLIVPPGDVDALAGAIERVYRDRTLRDALAVNAGRLAARYTMEAWKHRLVEILSSLDGQERG